MRTTTETKTPTPTGKANARRRIAQDGSVRDRWRAAWRRSLASGVGLGLTTLWVVSSAPGVASACSVCTAGREEENQLAFLLSTVFMSLLPLIVIGTLVFVLWRRIRKLEAGDEVARSPRVSSELGSRATSGLG